MNSMRKKLTLIICILFLLFSSVALPFLPKKVEALECQDITDTQQKIDCLSNATNQAHQQGETLKSEITYMDNQIDLTLLQIDQTENKIVETQKEIDLLTTRIQGLDGSLNLLSKLLIERVVTGYKKGTVSFLDVLLDSSNADELINRAKYLKTAQDTNQKLLVQVQETKLNFEEQKKIRETKEVELNQLNDELNAQKASLDSQKAQKQKLLTDTQNDEATYQRLLSQARAQLAGFKNFVFSSGIGVIGANQFGNGSDGSYYSQRDARWAGNTIGYSSENILDVGCLLTSIAMVAKHLGANVTPADIAGDVSRFFGSTAYMRLPWPGVSGRSYASVGTDDGSISQELSNGNYVIVGVGSCANGGSHFVVLTKKNGSGYTMHDPIYGPDTNFYDHYSGICSAATFK